MPFFELVKAPACALGPAPFVPYILGSKKKKKKKKGVSLPKGLLRQSLSKLVQSKR